MNGADFGVNLAFWLTILSTILCVWYGIKNWNNDGVSSLDRKQKTWAKVEDKIDEGL